MTATRSRRARRLVRVGQRRKLTSLTLVVTMIGALSLLVGVGTSGAVTTNVVVGAGDIAPNPGGAWSSPPGSDTGSVGFVSGPATPPSGVGSLSLDVTAGQHRSFYNYSYGICNTGPSCTGGPGITLASIDALGFSTYRTSATSALNSVPSLNIEIDPNPTVVPGPHYTTLVWERTDQVPVPTTVDDAWETWDAYNGGSGRFWSTQLIPGFATAGVGGERHTWNDIVSANPNAAIKFGIGPNIGAGPTYHGFVDQMSLGISANTTVFDFEPNCTTACFVSPSGSDFNTGRSGDPFLTIQKGIDTVSAGGTVTVAAGTYNESLTIPKSLTLKGANFGVNGTAPRGAESVIQKLSGAGKLIDITTANPVTIDGFTEKFLGTETVGGVLNNTQTSNQVTYTHNIVRDSVYVNALLNVTQVGTATIKFNKFDSLDQSGSPGSCVLCAWGNPTTQANLDIQSNTFSNLTDDDGVPAININNAGGTVNGNTFSTIHQYGILLADKLANLNITNNTFNNIINDSPGNQNRGSGIRTFGQPNIAGPVNITGNTFSNSAHGVRVANDFGPATIPAAFKVNRNALTSNSGTGISVDPSTIGTVDGKCNWWGAPSAPVLTGVTTTPYLQTSNLNGACTGGGPVPVVSVGNLAVAEGNSGTTAANVPVTLSFAYGLPVTVKYATTAGTAKTPEDFPTRSGTLTIPANTTAATIPLGVYGGVVLEQNEAFTVAISQPTNATLGTATGTVTIRNDERPTVIVKTVKAKEGQVNAATITLKQPYAFTLNLAVKTVNGTAAAPGDFTAVNTVVSFPSQNQGPKTQYVVIKTDGLKEGVESFTLQVTGGSAAVNQVIKIGGNKT